MTSNNSCSPPGYRQGRPYQIVVLDDTECSAKLVELILKSNLHCDVSIFHCAEELLNADPGQHADLYLLDIRLQNSSGIEVCRSLRMDEKNALVPMIFFSAHGSPQTRVEALRAGGIDYIDKPFYPEELLARVQGHLNLHTAHNRIQRQFADQKVLLRVLCHDLKNPIASSCSLLEMLQDTEGNHREYSDLALESCRHALELIDNVSSNRNLLDANDLSKCPPIDLGDAIAYSLRIMNHCARQKSMEIRSDVPPHLFVRIHPVVLCHSIINNLIHNAIKFSYRGTGILVAAKVNDEAGQPTVTITILDQGIGIPSFILEAIDNESNCLPSREGTSGERGTGYGLPLVKYYIARAGGQFKIGSREKDPENPEIKSGTAVSFTLPLEKSLL